MKMTIDKANSRGHADHGWLKTYHTFSFANYYNPDKMHFGMLRVLNDDTVSPGMGFDTHPHQNMEVISIPLKGSLRHGDSIENGEVIKPGDIQVMSTGTGIYHSEYNDSKEEDLKFLQIWIFPNKENTKPKYKSYDIRGTQKKNEFGLIISPDGKAPASILQDAWISLGTFESKEKKEYKLHGKNNGVYIFVIEGEIKINNTALSKRDGAGVYDTDKINLETFKKSTILLIEVPIK